MPRRKRQVKKQPEPAPKPVAKIKTRRRRKPLAEPVPVVAEVKSVMHRILEGQREQLIQMREDIQQIIFLGW
jgi:hypothetical protein